jgi:hypothetical protein
MDTDQLSVETHHHGIGGRAEPSFHDFYIYPVNPGISVIWDVRNLGCPLCAWMEPSSKRPRQQEMQTIWVTRKRAKTRPENPVLANGVFETVLRFARF